MQRALKRGNVFVAVNWGGTLVVAVYAPPNASLYHRSQIPSQMECMMNEVRNAVISFSVNRRQTLVLRDFNAKSVQRWGIPEDRREGRIHRGMGTRAGSSTPEPWEGEHVRQKQGESIVDLFWVSFAAARCISVW